MKIEDISVLDKHGVEVTYYYDSINCNYLDVIFMLYILSTTLRIKSEFERKSTIIIEDTNKRRYIECYRISIDSLFEICNSLRENTFNIWYASSSSHHLDIDSDKLFNNMNVMNILSILNDQPHFLEYLKKLIKDIYSMKYIHIDELLFIKDNSIYVPKRHTVSVRALEYLKLTAIDRLLDDKYCGDKNKIVYIPLHSNKLALAKTTFNGYGHEECDGDDDYLSILKSMLLFWKQHHPEVGKYKLKYDKKGKTFIVKIHYLSRSL